MKAKIIKYNFILLPSALADGLYTPIMGFSQINLLILT